MLEKINKRPLCTLNVENFRIREVFPYSEDQIVAHSEQLENQSKPKDGWDITLYSC